MDWLSFEPHYEIPREFMAKCKGNEIKPITIQLLIPSEIPRASDDRAGSSYLSTTSVVLDSDAEISYSNNAPN